MVSGEWVSEWGGVADEDSRILLGGMLGNGETGA